MQLKKESRFNQTWTICCKQRNTTLIKFHCMDGNGSLGGIWFHCVYFEFHQAKILLFTMSRDFQLKLHSYIFTTIDVFLAFFLYPTMILCLFIWFGLKYILKMPAGMLKRFEQLSGNRPVSFVYIFFPLLIFI